MTGPSHAAHSAWEAVSVLNGDGAGKVVLVCDHASNHVPAEFASLGLSGSELARHIAWDPGAFAVAGHLSALLDAPLVASRVSRLVVDCNRGPDAPDLVAQRSESTVIPGNFGLSAAERRARVALAHTPFHAAIEALLDARMKAGRETWLISIHSYTPVYKSEARPWHIGVVHDEDQRLSDPLLSALAAEPNLTVGDNQPYSPADRVYYTLERHARARGLPCVMIEIRNDEIASAGAHRLWAERLAGHLAAIDPQPVSLLAAAP